MYPYLLNTAHLILILVPLHYAYWCFRFKTPLSNYKVEEGFQSIIAIGNRSTTVSTTGMAMFRTNSGFFASSSYASNNVPNSYATELKVGYAARLFYGDAFIANQKSTGGVDIFGEGSQVISQSQR
jgi:hypothetical protein